MDFLIDLIINYGYVIVFVGTFLEGETVVALAGFAAYQGHLKLELLIPVAVCGAVIGDQFFFYLGRMKGRDILAKHPEWNTRVEAVHVRFERYQSWLIFGSRFMYGFRMMIPIILGAGRVSGVRFFVLNLMGAIVWAILFTFGGYVFGGAIEHFLGNVKKFEGIIVLLVLGFVAVIQGIGWYRRRQGKSGVVK